MSDDRREAYLKKLRDPRWQKMRLEVMNRDEWTCQQCLDKESTLHVHHRYYIQGAEPWEYPLEALVTLCEVCHESEGPQMQEAKELLVRAVATHFLGGDVLAVAEGFHRLKLRHLPGVVASAIRWALEDEVMQDQIIEGYFAVLKQRREDSEQQP
jgi:hypothetical protein